MISQLHKAILTGFAISLASSSLFAQDKPRVSPSDTVTATVSGAEISIVYSRPYTKDPKSGEMRKIWGTLVPYGKVWRMGANEATILKTSKNIEIGGKEVPAGSYSLYMWPEEGGSKLIINKQTGQWGTKYDEAQDLMRVDLKKEAADKEVDQFTMAIDKSGSDGGALKMMWEKTQFSVPFKVK